MRDRGGSYIPVVLTFAYDATNGFTLTEYWEPRDGSYYNKDLKVKFYGRPWPDTQEYITEQSVENYVQAMEYYGVGTDVLIRSVLDNIQGKAQFTFLENLLEGEDHDVQILLHYGMETLEYCFTQFLNGNQSGEMADTMAAVCKKIISEWGESLPETGSNSSVTAQAWFDFFFEQALNYQEMYSQDELLEKYPAACVLLKLTGYWNSLPDWGVTVTAENASASGLNLVVTQSGGQPAGDLILGIPYFLQKNEEDVWRALPPMLEAFGWDREDLRIPANQGISCEINWAWLYGELEAGQYRIGVYINAETPAGDYEQAVYYAEFAIS